MSRMHDNTYTNNMTRPTSIPSLIPCSHSHLWFLKYALINTFKLQMDQIAAYNVKRVTCSNKPTKNYYMLHFNLEFYISLYVPRGSFPEHVVVNVCFSVILCSSSSIMYRNALHIFHHQVAPELFYGS